MTIDDRFLILKFSLKVGKRTIPLWYKIFQHIEEIFRDSEPNGFHMEDTQTEDIVYLKNLYLCLSIAYTWMIILGADCSKNKKLKLWKLHKN